MVGGAWLGDTIAGDSFRTNCLQSQIKCDSWLSSLHHRFPFIQMKTGAQFLLSFSPSSPFLFSPILNLSGPPSPPPPALTFSGRLFIMSTKAFLVMKWSWSLYFFALYLVGKGSVPPRETVLTPILFLFIFNINFWTRNYEAKQLAKSCLKT